MNRIILLLVIMIATLPVSAQVTDNFSDGDFTNDPNWMGDTASFTVSSQRLQLTAPPAAGVSYLATLNNAIFLASWEFTVELQFNTSASNYARFYLVSDQQDLNGPLNGYFVQIGGTMDDVSLYRQTGTAIYRLIDGLDGRINFALVKARIRVLTDAETNWKLEVDTGADGSTGVYVTEGTSQDATHRSNSYSGFRCVYTSTRADKFFLDDVRCTGQPWPDREPAEVTSAQMPDSIHIVLKFSETLDQSSLTQPAHYGAAVQATMPAEGAQAVQLKLKSALSDGEAVTLKLNGLTDLAGNIMRDTLVEVYWLRRREPLQGDVLINEIMADPTPTIGLPEVEYVELLNRSQQPFNLEGWRFGDGSSFGVLPRFILRAGEMVTVVDKMSVSRWSGTVISVEDFPSLNNSGDRLILLDSCSHMVDEVNYSSGWHTVSGKEDGGWSLERIDPRNACDDEDNWASSIDQTGGTPGRANSVLASHPDLSGPGLIQPVVNSPNEVQVDTDERIDQDSFLQAQVQITPMVPVDTFFLMENGRRILVRLADSLHRGIFYQLEIKGMRDCPGNFSESPKNRIKFILPFGEAPMDVIINEILFDPQPGGVDFVELFNRSGKYLELRNWRLANGKSDSIVNPKTLTPRLICPGCFIVLTTDAVVLKASYPSMPDSTVMEMTLPALPDDEGSVILLTEEWDQMDTLNYNQDWHLSLIRSPEGVSLERMSAWSNSQDRNNWRSAGSGWGTPGLMNSCAVDSARREGQFKIEPEVLDRRTGEDFALIRFQLPVAGLIAHAEILDYDGYPVRMLANNEPVATEGFFRWDLDRDDGKVLRPGFYVVLIEVFDSKGYRRLFRGRIILLP